MATEALSLFLRFIDRPKLISRFCTGTAIAMHIIATILLVLLSWH